MSEEKEDLLKKLEAAGDDPVAQTLAMVDFTCGENAALRRAVDAAAIPHWFDAKILEAILDPEDQPESESLYRQLLDLSFVEAFDERAGHNIHEATRRALRNQIAKGNRERFIELSQRATRFFSDAFGTISTRLQELAASNRATDPELAAASSALLNELLFHLAVADPVQGRGAIHSVYEQMDLRGAYQAILQLAQQLDELIDDELLVEPVRAAIQYVRGEARIPFGKLEFVENCAKEAIRGYHSAGFAVQEANSHHLLGKVRIDLGDLPGAEEAFLEHHRITESALAAAPDNPTLQKNLSVSWSYLGNVQVSRGNLEQAEASYGKSLEIAKRLADQDASNSGRQRDLSVSGIKLGDVQVTRGNLEEAEASYGKSLEIAKRLADQDASNSGWQRDLSVSWERLGDVQVTRGNLEEAEATYGKSLEIAKRLADQDASNSGWQRDLSVSWIKLGDVQVTRENLEEAEASYGKSLEIRKCLADQDASNSGWQRDLSVSWNNVGELELKRGNAAEAEVCHRKALTIDERLAESDPDNYYWQVGVSVSSERLGDTLLELGHFDDAAPFFARSLEIAERVAETDPERFQAERWTNLADTLGRVAKFAAKRGEMDEARDHYGRALGILRDLQAEGRLTHKQEEQIEEFEKALAEL